MSNNRIRPAPTTFWGILRELGPGLIVAGSIVGSGELIATTATGAEAGFWLMWIIIIGCVIKVFVQVEIGRYVILTGRTALAGITRLPGPRIAGTHFIVWCWLFMIIASTGQMGGIVGGVGQAISIAAPLTEEGAAFNRAAEEQVLAKLAQSVAEDGDTTAAGSSAEALPDSGPDVFFWALAVSIFTAVVLYLGRYGAIQTVVTSLVGIFTVMTLINLVLLQLNPDWALSWADIKQGLSFKLPPPSEGINPVATALATFGIIGVGAGELIYYPYWCLEKGYAAFIGPREDSKEWTARAKGWLCVLKWDAWLSMVVYTVSTVIFYILGATILHRADLHPQGMEMIRTLAAMYEPVFGQWAVGLFLIGSVLVLYSTFFVANASKGRIFADAMIVFGWRKSNPKTNHKWVKWLCFAFPLIALLFFIIYPKPKELVLLSGGIQSMMLPLLGFSAIYFRYKYAQSTLPPSRLWDVFLWLSALGLLLVGAWLAWTIVSPLLG